MKKGRLITSIVFAALSLLVLAGLVGYLIRLETMDPESFGEGLGEVILFVLYIAFAAIAVAVFSTVGFFTAVSATKSEALRIRRAAWVLFAYHALLFVADIGVALYGLVSHLRT